MNGESSSGAPALTPDRWAQLDDIFNAALELPTTERPTFLHRACAGDGGLRAEVEALLAAHAQTGGPLDRLARLLIVESSRHGEPPIRAEGATIGPYAIVREIGRGGMGIVYLARRADGQYHREVALKLIRNPLRDDLQRQRFLAERQIQARLAHPGIAQLFDGGVTDEGHPYFTMEYVPGEPIDVYCDRRALMVVDRLRLFTRVCEAVSAAHRALVVHRDLKPTNVLVSDEGDVKLLDFGIAKLLDRDAEASLTHTGGVLFTPEYASPEQVRAAPITTATDVYSLGAMLYHLLTGAGPHRFRGRTAADIERAICEEEPPIPSVAIATLGASDPQAAAAAAAGRRTTVARLGSSLAGDLDTIVLKALHKDPARRYPSVDDLRQDVLHHLAGRPVSARPDDWQYRARAFVRRHRVIVGAGLLVAASLLVGLLATLWQARQARLESAQAAAERDRAALEAARARRVAALLTDLFRMADPGQAGGPPISARDVLQRGTRRIEVELGGDPETQAALFTAVGQVYRNLALYDDARRSLERAVVLRRQTSGTDSPGTAESLHHLALVRRDLSDFAGAEDLLREALEIRLRRDAPALDTAATQAALGETLSEAGRYEEAETLLRTALDTLRVRGGEPAQVIQAIHQLGLVLHRRGDFGRAEELFRESVAEGRALGSTMTPAHASALIDLARLVHRFDRKPREAEPLFAEALQVLRTLYTGDHPSVAECMAEFARAQSDSGRLAEAEALGREAFAMYRRLYGDRHREVLIITQSLAGYLKARGKRVEAEPLYRDALAMGRALFEADHPLVLSAMSALASFLEENRRWAEALPLREAEVAGAIARFGEDHAVVARAVAGLGRHHLARGRVDQALPELQRALDIRQRIHPAGHWRIAEAQGDVGVAMTRQRRFAEAEPPLRSAYETLRGNREAPPDEARAAQDRLVALYEAWNRPDAADRVRAPAASIAKAPR